MTASPLAAAWTRREAADAAWNKAWQALYHEARPSIRDAHNEVLAAERALLRALHTQHATSTGGSHVIEGPRGSQARCIECDWTGNLWTLSMYAYRESVEHNLNEHPNKIIQEI